MSTQLALRFSEVPITCETRAAVSFNCFMPGRETIGGRTGGCDRSLCVLSVTSLDLSHALSADIFRHHTRSPKGHNQDEINLT
jgi:hypothetical protein